MPPVFNTRTRCQRAMDSVASRGTVPRRPPRVLELPGTSLFEQLILDGIEAAAKGGKARPYLAGIRHPVSRHNPVYQAPRH
jgi:hypothetical protein